MHLNSLFPPDSTSPGCPPPVQLIGQIAAGLFCLSICSLNIPLMFIILIKAKSNILSRISRLRNDCSDITNGSS